MSRATASLMAEVFPSDETKPSMSSPGSQLSIVLFFCLFDYNPQHSWRNHV